ncbi:hypothetical protein SAMD00019534_050640 [Acytostelium subglobosum LB1]|uniref:hypothetical protein n=1 Tax=Acytostelium subglobosum LB1 TaxID=1410327 RepID=UPI000644AF30|nr:hypothetical protein SAMD00019534_050640 [Acytostelium subglobosum LB1]GAM21889.1 hypothetical protein SAMD00019534_050640 [Acytostelium subglobosum LB1]|eukprot:XP_012754989.1 hypothetical protein SAMD00019534_050640 [Acytostelium subglobosum LB1]
MTVAVKDETVFHQIFSAIPNDEKLIEEYSCSYNEGGSVSIGRLYISQHHVSYAPKIGSTQIVVPIKDITNISKKYSVYLFPNAIEINTNSQRYFFSAFLSRDLAFATLQTIIQAGGGTRTKMFEDVLSHNESSDNNNNNSSFSSSNGNGNSNNNNNNSKITVTKPDPEEQAQQQQSQEHVDDNIVGDNQQQTESLGSSVSSDTSTNSGTVSLTPPLQSAGQNANKEELPEAVSTAKIEENNSAAQQQTPSASPPPPSSSTINQATELKESTPPSTPLKREDSQLSINDLSSRSSQATPQPQQTQSAPAPAQAQAQPQSQSQTPSKASPPATRKDSNNSPATPTKSTNKPAAPAPASTPAPAPASAAPASATSASSASSTPAAAGKISSPSPASIAHSARPAPYNTIPLKEKCEHVLPGEFEEAPWCTEKYAITVEEFYNVIIRSDFWAQVNTTHGYTEQSVSEWKQGTCCTSRVVDFRTAMSFKIGPKSTRVVQTQRCRFRAKDEILVGCSSVSREVPYGDSFSVENLLLLTPDPDNNGGCILKLSSKIKFTKTLWGIQTMIQKSAAQGNKDFFGLWFTMVRNQVDVYSFNKMKQNTSSTNLLQAAQPDAKQPSQQQQQQPTSQQQEQPAQQTQQQQPSQSFTERTLESSQATQSSSSSNKDAVPDTKISLSTLWTNMSSSEKRYLAIGLCFIVLLFVGLAINVIGNARSNQALSQELYKFSDSIVLLDSKLNSMTDGKNPLTEPVTLTSNNIGQGRLEELQRRLEMAATLLQRTQSLIESLQGELSIEALKSKRLEQSAVDGSGGSSLLSIIFTVLLVVGSSFIVYSFNLLQHINDLLFNK